MAIPSIFTQRGSKALANYDFFDLAAGVGYKEFSGLNLNGSVYSLVGESFYSNEFYTDMSANGAEVNFNINFSRPMVLANASAFVSLFSKLYQGNGASSVAYTIRVLHVTAGGVETDIGGGAKTTDTQSFAGGSGSTRYDRYSEGFTITQTAIKRGETIRIEVISTTSLSTNGSVSLFHDPANRMAEAVTRGYVASGYASLTFDVLLPFKIDI